MEKHRKKVQKQYKKKRDKSRKNSTTNKYEKQTMTPGNAYERLTKQNSINILTTNAAGLKHKATDLKKQSQLF